MRSGHDPADGCEHDRLVRAHLSRVVEPGDRALPADDDPAARRSLVEALQRGRGPEVWRARHARLEEPTVAFVDRAARAGVDLLVPEDPRWPDGLRDLAQLPVREGPDGGPPVCLWVRGTLPEGRLAPPAAAVVGARACSAYGEHVAQDLAAGLVVRGWTVVSGAAYGVDAAAHRGALAMAADAVTPTVAVLAGGADRASPAGHDELLRRTVEQGGAVVSEVPPGTRPAAYRFLLRNRLIAAWALGVVVVEASHRSGALNTARTALDLSRHVASVPGPVTSVMSVGTNRLLRDGAACVTDADDVVDLMGRIGLFPEPVDERRARRQSEGGPPGPVCLDDVVEALGPEAVRVWQELGGRRGRDVDALVVAVGLGHRLVARSLAALELAGVVVRGEGGWRRGVPAGGGPDVVP